MSHRQSWCRAGARLLAAVAGKLALEDSEDALSNRAVPEMVHAPRLRCTAGAGFAGSVPPGGCGEGIVE